MANILLIEPDRTLATVYKTALEQDGHTVICRRTAASAVATLDQESIEVIVLELNLAVHNGVEFLYEMRSYPDWQDVQVILHTNVRHKQVEPGALKQLGVTDFLYKPTTTLAQLRQVVTRVLQTVV